MADKTDYVVLKQVEDQAAIEEAAASGARVWVEVASSISADGNKDAITRSTSGWDDDKKRGNYAAPSARNFPVIPRDVTTKVIDEFGEPSTAGTRQRRKAPAEAPAE